METHDDNNNGDSPQSFIVRIWVEEPMRGSRPTSWRGHITHVHAGERRYFEDLDAIAAFIRPYLEQMGVRFGWWARIRRLFRC